MGMNKKSNSNGNCGSRVKGHFNSKKKNFSQQASDNLAIWAGSWKFILSLIFILIIWIFLNLSQLFFHAFDPYPFILMNLFLSCLAAFQAPVILMSQNRAAERDRVKAERDFAINRKAERENRVMQRDIDSIKRQLREINKKL